MLTREIETHLLKMWKSFPVITITGPRQSGKTTLAKKLFPGLYYINLEDPAARQFAMKYYSTGFILLFLTAIWSLQIFTRHTLQHTWRGT